MDFTKAKKSTLALLVLLALTGGTAYAATEDYVVSVAGTPGANAIATGAASTALGYDSVASGINSTALGNAAQATGTAALAVGRGASATQQAAIAIGGSTASAQMAIALGTSASSTGQGSIAVGAMAAASKTANIAIGVQAAAIADDSIGIGYQAQATGVNSIVIGVKSNTSDAGGNLVIGNNSKATFASNVVLGNDAYAGPDTQGSGATVGQSVAIGNESRAGATGGSTGAAVAVGFQSTADAWATAVGKEASASFSGVGIGGNSKADGDYSVAIGTGSTATQENSVAIGRASGTTAAVQTQNITINGTTYSFAGSTGILSSFSVGNVGGLFRQVQNVAPGQVSATSTDAVNGSQLFAATQAIEAVNTDIGTINGKITNITSEVDNALKYDTAAKDTITLLGTGGTTINNVKAGALTSSSTDAVNGSQLFATNQKVDTLETAVNAGWSATVDGAVVKSVNPTDASLNFISGSNIEITNEEGAIKISSLGGMDAEALHYSKDANGKVDKTKVELGDGTTPTTVSNVAAGEISATSTQAVNGSQLYQHTVGLSSRLEKLDSRVDKVGAGAAALAALHPLDFDPEDKWNVAAGLGSYSGEQALALGAFYRPNEGTMFSLAVSTGNGENMYNLGASFALDGKPKVLRGDRRTLLRTVQNLAEENRSIKAQNQFLTAKLEDLSAKVAMLLAKK